MASRPTKVRVEQFAPAPDPGSPQGAFDRFLPDILKGESLRALLQAWVQAMERRRSVIGMLGGHVIKTGVQRPLLALVERGAFTAIAMNGAAASHDFEIAMWGNTSEPVEECFHFEPFVLDDHPVRPRNLAREGDERSLLRRIEHRRRLGGRAELRKR